MKVILTFCVLLSFLSMNSFGTAFNAADELVTTSDTSRIPVNLDDCITRLDRIIPDSTKSQISAMTEEQFSARSHFGLGMWMRNNWELWRGSELANFFKSKGIYHPDDMSGIILDSYYRHLTKQDIKLEEQIRHYQEYWEKAKINQLEQEKGEFQGYNISDTVLFLYKNGFSSSKQRDNYEDDLCTATGVITDRNEEKFFIKVKLLDDCDKRGIIAYDNKGAFVLDSNTGKMEKPKKRTRKHVRVGEENWFIYSDWKRKGS